MPTALGFIPIFTSPVDVAIAITSPSAGTDIDPYVGTTISGTCSASTTTVQVFLGVTSLGFAVVTGTTWSLAGVITSFSLAGAAQTLTAVANRSITSAAVSIDVLTVRESFALIPGLLRVWFPPATVATDYRVDAGNAEGGTRVDRWYSQTDPVNHTLSMDTDGDQPQLQTVSSTPGLTFDAGDGTSGDRMNFATAFLSGLANFDFFIAYRRAANAAAEDIIDADAGEFRIRFENPNTHFRVYVGSTSNNGRTTNVGAEAATDRLALVRWDGAGVANADRLKVFIDGVERALTFTGTVAQSAGHTAMCTGRTTGNTTPFGGTIYMVGAFNANLAGANLTKFYDLCEQFLPWFTAP